MSNLAVFAVGLLVTLMVAGAMTLLIWGAVIDGREDEERRADNEQSAGGDAEIGRLGVAGAL